MGAIVDNSNGTVPMPEYTISYNQIDVTRDLADYLISLEWEDSVEGESGSICIELENHSQLFSNGWYPQKGSVLSATIGLLKCGNFTIDEIVLSGKPDTIKMKGLTNQVTTKSLKTKRSRAHENKTLAQIASAVAKANSLTLIGNVPAISIERVTQRRETDLKFLRRVSWDYGIIFSVRDSKLVFTSLKALEANSPVLTLDITDLLSYEITDKTDKTFKAAQVKSHNPKTRQVVTGNSNIVTLQNPDEVQYTQILSADTVVVHKKAENQQQADAMADAVLYRANTWVQSGTIETPGKSSLIAGCNIELTGLGVAGSGIYNMAKCKHTVNRTDAWVISTDIKRIAPVAKAKHISKLSTRQPTTSKNNIVTLQNPDEVQFTQIVPVFE